MKRQHNYVQTPVPLILDTRLTGNDLRVLIYLAWRQGNHENTWPSIRTIARELHIDRTTAQLCINKLRHTRYLSVGQIRCPKGKKNTYKVDLEVVRKIRTSACGKSALNYTTVNKTDPAFGEPVGQKAGAKRETLSEKVRRKLCQEDISRREQLKQAKEQAEQQKTTNPPDKEVNHGTK